MGLSKLGFIMDTFRGLHRKVHVTLQYTVVRYVTGGVHTQQQNSISSGIQ